MDIRFVVIHQPGSKWVMGVDFQEQAGVMDHVMHFKKFQDDGKLELGGPFLDNTGGMMVSVAGVTEAEIRTLAESDPTVSSGLLSFQIKPWFIAMKKG